MQQQQQDASTSGGEAPPSLNVDSAADEVAAALNEITEASGGVEGRDDPEMMVGSDNQQVFTVDTGIGNCDMAGMPTLADASLAETAARLQQVCTYALFHSTGSRYPSLTPLRLIAHIIPSITMCACIRDTRLLCHFLSIQWMYCGSVHLSKECFFSQCLVAHYFAHT